VASVEFHDAASKLSTTLLGVSGSLPAGKVSLRDLLELIGEQGMLLVCVFLTLPFLLPVSIPGVSTVFGLAIILIGVGVTQPRAVASAPDSGPAVVDCAHQAGVPQGCPFRRSFRADGAAPRSEVLFNDTENCLFIASLLKVRSPTERVRPILPRMALSAPPTGMLGTYRGSHHRQTAWVGDVADQRSIKGLRRELRGQEGEHE
jgi:hypothetical protein